MIISIVVLLAAGAAAAKQDGPHSRRRLWNVHPDTRKKSNL